MKIKKINTKGFTLLEILLVVGIISILAGIVIIAINPNKQLGTTRDLQRKQAIGEINKALVQYYIDNGEYPTYADNLDTTLKEICNTGTTESTDNISECTNNDDDLINLTQLVPDYLSSIPVDPAGSLSSLFIQTVYAAGNGTGYKVAKNSNNNIYVEAPRAEIASLLKVGSNTGVDGDGEGSN